MQPPDLHDLRPTSVSLLRALPLDGSVARLAERLDWSPAQVHQYLLRLRRDGLAARDASGWTLTSLGQAVLRGVSRAHDAYVRETNLHRRRQAQGAEASR